MTTEHRPLITVHSGGFSTPANSMAYLKLACEKRPDIIEIDVRATLDNVVILSHDPAVGNSVIAEVTSAQLFETNPTVITLEQALRICEDHRIGLNLDIKEQRVIDPLLRILDRHKSERPFIFSGCGRPEVEELHRKSPRSRVLYNADPWDWKKVPDYRDYMRAQLSAVKELNCFGLNISCEDLRPEFMGYSRLYDIPILVWTVDDEERMQELITLGVYSITTNNVDLLRTVLRRNSGRKLRLYDTDWIKHPKQ